MSCYPHNRNVRFVALTGKDHFSDLRPTNALLARAILAATSHASFKLKFPR